MLGGKMMRNCWRAVAASVVLVLVVCLAWAADSPGGRVFRTPQPPAAAQLGDIWVNPKDGGEMVYVPAGEFLMGSSDAQIAALIKSLPFTLPDFLKWVFEADGPQRKVYLDGYWIYKCEVTVAQYRKFCQATGREMPEAPAWGWQNDHPMVNVTWQEAADYAKWASVSLPTEAQWEKAARGTDGRSYPWGNGWDATRCANSVVKKLTSTQPVGSYAAGASPYGCLDMTGNVLEWCADWYDPAYYKRAPTRNPTGPAKAVRFEFLPGSIVLGARVLRGGSWDNDLSAAFQCASRPRHLSDDPTDRGNLSGFRCARTP